MAPRSYFVCQAASGELNLPELIGGTEERDSVHGGKMIYLKRRDDKGPEKSEKPFFYSALRSYFILEMILLSFSLVLETRSFIH
jgi:hypothetical protein